MTETMKLPKQPTPPVPCRLYVILAREAPVAVIFRRGPSKRVQIVKWDTSTDTFTPGQWFHGRIYQRRCDLSPDGRLLIYFAQNMSMRNQQSDYTSAWTAMSRPPYLTALALWPKGDCWDGGGSFLSDHEVWLNHPQGHTKPHTEHRPQGLVISHNLTTLGEDDPIFHRHLERDGWRHLQEWRGELKTSSFQRAYQEKLQAGLPITMDWMIEQAGQKEEGVTSGYVTHAPSIHEKLSPDEKLTLIMAMTLSRFQRQYTYSARDQRGHEKPIPDAEWADWDQRGRLVFAQAGKIYALEAGGFGQEPPLELLDLNNHKPEPMAAPDWAKVW